jgi:hypothetical protein
MRNFLILFFILFLLENSFSQNNSPKEIDLDKLIQELLRQQDLPDNYEDVYDVLYQYYLTPLDLNKSDREDLEGLYLLSTSEINSFIEHRSKYGQLSSIYELQAIQGWEMGTIRKLLPFVEVKEHFDKEKFLHRFLNNPNNIFLFRTDYVPQVRKGYLPDSWGNKVYQGSPYKHLIRYRNSIGKDFSVGLTMEKDAGELMVWKPSQKEYLMDYISFHAFLFNKGNWKAIGVGDYKLQFGQGLIFGGGFYMGKSAETILSVKKNGRGILPYSSIMESGFFRGTCFTYSFLKAIDLTVAYSYNNRDAVLHYDSLAQQEVLSAFQDYGMHRTKSELKTKGNLNEQNIGGNVSYYSKNKKFRSGISCLYTAFSKPVKESDRIYNRFDFKGKENRVVSSDFSWVIQNFNLFGEAAVSSGGGKAIVVGGIASLSSKIDFSYLYRNYGVDFHSFYANAFAEGTSPSNEKGNYWGLRVKPNGKWVFSAYYDHFIFPWLKYFKDSPTSGYGYLGRLQYSASKKIQLYYQLRYEESGKNQSDNFTNIDFTVPSRKYNSMLNLDCKSGIISIRSRVQWSSYRQSNGATKGFVIAQDLNLDFRKIKISARYALFDTDDYDNRQYVYEKDVLYSVSFPSYYGRGSRSFLILQFKLGKQTDVWWRYAVTNYTNKTTISSGWDEIRGSRISELKFQIRRRF